MPSADPFWQNAFVGAALLVLGWNVFMGWRAGIVRGIVALAALVAGGFVGLAMGGALAPVLGAVLPLPGLLIAVGLGLVVGLAIYFGARLLGALLFKRTAQQNSFVLKLIYGAGGAVVGAAFGLTVIWGSLLFVRALGGFYEGRHEAQRAEGATAVSPGAWALIKLKRSVEAGDGGRRIVAIDIVPASTYRIMEKLGRVASSPRTFHRLFEYPPMAELLMDSRIVAITSDPAALDAARAQSLGALLQNRHLINAANDPAFVAKVRQIDFEAALDFALGQASSPDPGR